MTWGMITFWWSRLVEYQIKPGERRMESVEGKRREKRLSISRGKLLQVKPRVGLVVCSPFLKTKTEKGRSNTRFSLYDRRFKLLLYRLKQTTLSSGLYFIPIEMKISERLCGRREHSSCIWEQTVIFRAADVGREPWPQRQPDNTGTIRSSRLWQWPVKKEAAINTPLTW